MPSPDVEDLHVAVALDGAGWHPAAWREPGARPAELFTARYWTDLVRTAERGLLDLVTIEDAFGLQSGDHLGEPERRTDRVQGRLDAELIAAFVAPLTRSIGLVPTVTTTHTEPFHVASALATLDHDSRGRAGWRVQTSVRSDEAAHFGRRTIPGLRRDALDAPEAQALIAELFGEAGDAVEVVRRLWDSWEDDAEIRDDASNRFLDRAKLHHVDFTGPQFSVRGPAIVPRPPQGQPLVVALGHGWEPFRLAARAADVLFVTPHDAADVAAILEQVRAAERDVGRTGASGATGNVAGASGATGNVAGASGATGNVAGASGATGKGAPPPLTVLGDLVVLLDDSEAAARERLARLDGLDPLTSDAAVLATTPSGLADLLLDWQLAGLDGFRLRPAVLPTDLDRIVDDLVPELQRRGAFRTDYAESTLRERFGLARPVSRYATAGV